jgi:hypothetical protein
VDPQDRLVLQVLLLLDLPALPDLLEIKALTDQQDPLELPDLKVSRSPDRQGLKVVEEIMDRQDRQEFKVTLVTRVLLDRQDHRVNKDLLVDRQDRLV